MVSRHETTSSLKRIEKELMLEEKNLYR